MKLYIFIGNWIPNRPVWKITLSLAIIDLKDVFQHVLNTKMNLENSSFSLCIIKANVYAFYKALILSFLCYMCEWCRYKENLTSFNISPAWIDYKKDKKEHIEKEEQKLVVLWLLCVIFLDSVLSLFAVTFQVHSPPSVLTTKNR